MTLCYLAVISNSLHQVLF